MEADTLGKEHKTSRGSQVVKCAVLCIRDLPLTPARNVDTYAGNSAIVKHGVQAREGLVFFLGSVK